MALTGNTMSATVNGYRARAEKVWFPTNGNWVADGSSAGITLSASRATTNGTTTSGNKYGQIIKITTPNDAGIASIQSISISFYVYDRNSTKGTLYGSLRTTYTDSTASDTDAFFRTNAIGSEASIANLTTTNTKITFTFTSSSLKKNTSYYLFLYTKSTADIYGFNNDYLSSATITYTKNSYTVKYDANGGTGAPGSQTKIYGETLTLSTTKPTKANTTGDVNGSFDITGNANGGYFGTTTTTTTKITATTKRTDTYKHTFSSWNTNKAGTGTAYSAGGSYTANSGATLYAIYTTSTTNGTTTYSNNAISSLAKPSRADSTQATYTIKFDSNGGSSCSDKSANKVRKYTFGGWATSATATSANASASYNSATTLYAYWSYKDSTGAITLPTPTKSGYTFMGWATTADATTADVGTGSFTPTANDTLYAVWSLDNSLIYYNDNGNAVLCMVYYNDNGNAVLCNVYYNDNGTAIRI